MNNACDFCRKRKLKCSREIPNCSACIKYNKDCNYTPRQRSIPLTKAYVQQLQRRIVYLEKSLANHRRSEIDIESNVIINNPTDISSNHVSNTLVKPKELFVEESFDKANSEDNHYIKKEDALFYEDFKDVDDLDWYEKDPASTNNENITADQTCDTSINSNRLIDGMGALSLGDESRFLRPHAYCGISSSNGLLRFLRSSENQQSNQIKQSNSSYLKYYSNLGLLYDQNNFKLLKSENSDILLNDISLRNDLINSYFNDYHCCYPFIQKGEFLKDYELYSLKATMHQEGKVSIKDISFQVLLNTVLAVGALCKFGEPSIIDLLYYKRVKANLQEINIMECGSYQLLNAFILLGNYVQKRNKPNTAWNYQGLSLRMAISFGFHKEINMTESNISQESKALEIIERRRRLWWGLFFFDVGLTITFGRPLHLPLLESIDIKYPLNIEDSELSHGGDICLFVKLYPTIYAGLQQEAKFSKISYRIYSYITKVSGSSMKIQTSKMAEMIEFNKLIAEFVNSLPQYFKEDDSLVSQNLYEVCPRTWFKVNLDGSLSIPKWFDFTRRRLIWRYKNVQILMFRSFIWETASLLDTTVKNNIFDDTRSSRLLDQCLNYCYQAAKDTINSISEFVTNCEIDITSSWYATYFIFQAVLVPILFLSKKGQEVPESDIHKWINDIDLAKSTLISLQEFNILARNLVETIDFLMQPILDTLNENRQGEEINKTGDNQNFNEFLAFGDLPTATINLFSNFGVDFRGLAVDDPDVLGITDERLNNLQTGKQGNRISKDFQREQNLSSDEVIINNFLQQELFPSDPLSGFGEQNEKSVFGLHPELS